jgi:hypothetical protein
MFMPCMRTTTLSRFVDLVLKGLASSIIAYILQIHM